MKIIIKTKTETKIILKENHTALANSFSRSEFNLIQPNQVASDPIEGQCFTVQNWGNLAGKELMRTK